MATAEPAAGQVDGGPAGRTVFGHPIGLANLFGVELWERFSFYGMLTILGYYLYYSAHRGRARAPQDHRDRHRRRLRRAGVPVHGARRLDRRPAARHGAHRVLRRRRGDVRAHRARHPARADGCRRRPRVGGAGLGRLEGQRLVAARHALRKGRPALRRRLHAVLSGHQPRRLRRTADHRVAADQRGLPLGLRRGGRRDGARADAVRGLPPQSRYPWPRPSQTRCRAELLDGLRRYRCRGGRGDRRGIRHRSGEAGEPVPGDDRGDHRRVRRPTSS